MIRIVAHGLYSCRAAVSSSYSNPMDGTDQMNEQMPIVDLMNWAVFCIRSHGRSTSSRTVRAVTSSASS